MALDPAALVQFALTMPSVLKVVQSWAAKQSQENPANQTPVGQNIPPDAANVDKDTLKQKQEEAFDDLMKFKKKS